MPRLIVIRGADEGKQFELTAPQVLIGRDAANQIRLNDTEVSRRHACLEKTPEGYRLRDVGSANGTFVNQQKITQEILLQAGDHIQVGQTHLVYSSGPGDGRETAPDLATQISLIISQASELPSAIVKAVSEAESRRLLRAAESGDDPAIKTQLAHLKILYEASQAVSHILDVDELLRRILSLVLRAIQADRGCIMLRNPETGQLEPRAVYWRETADSQEKFTVSRTIIDYVLREKQGVLLSDAAQDERFNTGQSIFRFGIREVLCVPMKGRHETLGVLYLDTRTTGREIALRKTTTAKFTEDHLFLAVALGHQAALAVEETRYHQALLKAERLAAIGQTIAALSHHIKNILQGLRSGSEILKMGLAEKNDTLLQQGWRTLEKNQEKIYNLVMDMLSYSKEREPALEETDLNQIVRDVAELLAGRARELGVRLEVSLDENLPLVQADPEGIHRALLNIAGNALDAVEGRKNPKVTLASRLDPEAGWVRLLVVDNGVGIPPDKLPHIFKPFFSTKGARGTGLGLAVSQKILHEHGGDILVQSQTGAGSKFILRLPIRSPLAAEHLGESGERPPEPPETEE